jgi:hypothetical protein
MTLLGAALLLVTTGTVTVGALVIPMTLLGLGGALFWRAFLPDGREANVFAGTFLGLTGAFLIVRESTIAALHFDAIWPVYMTIVGCALMAYGFKKGRDYRFSMVVPGVALVVLSGFFLLFSLNIVEASLAETALRWWPVTFVIVGLTTVAAGTRSGDGEAPGADGETPGADGETAAADNDSD